MLNLESKLDVNSKIKEYILVPMHKLTSHKLIKEDLVYVSDICDLPNEILCYRFFFDIKIKDNNCNFLNIKFYGNEACKFKEDKNIITDIKIRFLLNYLAASKEHQKVNNKIILDKN